MMRMEFGLMTGVFISQQAAPVDGKSKEELVAQARDALASFYEGDEYSVWVRKEHIDGAPETVSLFNSGGEVVLEYDLTDFLAESKRALILPDVKQVG